MANGVLHVAFQFLLLYVFPCLRIAVRRHVEGMDDELRPADVQTTNSTFVDPLTLTGFMLSSTAAAGSMYGMYKNYKALKNEKRDYVMSRMIVKAYREKTAQGCAVIDHLQSQMVGMQKGFAIMRSKKPQLDAVCRQSGRHFVAILASVLSVECSRPFAAGTQPQLLANAPQRCKDFANNHTSRMGFADICEGGASLDKRLHALENKIAELRGLKQGVCPSKIPEDWNPPLIQKDNMETLLKHYPKCKRVGNDADWSHFCWTSCIDISKRNICEKLVHSSALSFRQAGIVIARPSGTNEYGENMACRGFLRRPKGRALCQLTSSGPTSLFESHDLFTALTGILGLAYAVIGLSDFSVDLFETAVNSNRGFMELLSFSQQRLAERTNMLCRNMEVLWIQEAFLFAIISATLVERYRSAGFVMPDALTVSNASINEWEHFMPSPLLHLKDGSEWSCKPNLLEPNSGCLLPRTVTLASAGTDKVANLYSALDAPNDVTTLVEEACITDHGDFRVCSADNSKLLGIVPATCFDKQIILRLASESQRKTCLRPWFAIRQSLDSLNQIRKSSVAMCS